jgi:hypothetical protein
MIVHPDEVFLTMEEAEHLLGFDCNRIERLTNIRAFFYRGFAFLRAP